MKYIKLFENFDDREDPKFIIITHLGEVDEVETDNKNIRLFNLRDIADNTKQSYEDKIKSCYSHLKEAEYFMYIFDEFCIVINSDLNIINSKFDIRDNEAKVLYVDDEEEVIFYHYKEIDTFHSHMVRTTRCYFNYDLIWSFFQNEMNIRDNEIGEMMAFWIKDFYDIDLRPVKLKITYDMLD